MIFGKLKNNYMKVNVNNTDELRVFGARLNLAGETMDRLFLQLTTEMHKTCDNWNDSNAALFMNQLEESKSQIVRISQQMHDFSQYITKTCNILEEYNNQRY